MVAELGLRDTNGILRQPWVRSTRSSTGLGWERLYVSAQSERPYRASFDAANTHLLILHLDGPVRVVRGEGRRVRSRRIPAGGLFLHPAGHDLTVELGGPLDTIHTYLADSLLQEAAGEGRAIELIEELGVADPLLEQLVLGLDGTVRQWEPSARTYLDHLSTLLAAHLARRHSTVARPASDQVVPGLSARQLDAARDLMDARLAEPLPLADLAAVVSLSVSQFTRQFKASTGDSPHRFLMKLRLEQATRLLRRGKLPIAEVALRCGFSHQEHLTRAMRTKLGTTPGAVRREG